MTTRTPRPEERQGVDYTFLSKEEFIALEKSGELLESGIFDGKPTVLYYFWTFFANKTAADLFFQSRCIEILHILG